MVKKVTGPKIVQKGPAGHVETDMVGAVVVVVGIHTPEIHMTIIETDILHPHWTDSDHILTPMTGGRPHLGTPTTETEIHMQDPHQSIMEEGIDLSFLAKIFIFYA